MGSSYASDLRSGRMPEQETKLREAVRLVRGVIDEWFEFMRGEDQFDNAADDGALVAELGQAIRFIEDNLPDPARKSARELADALRQIQEKGLRMEYHPGASDGWLVGGTDLHRWGKTLPAALHAYLVDSAPKKGA